jgi:hypothetical protein
VYTAFLLCLASAEIVRAQNFAGVADPSDLGISAKSASEADAAPTLPPMIDAPSHTVLMRSASPAFNALMDASSTTSQGLPYQPTSRSNKYIFPSFHQREHAYFYDLIGPGAFIGAAVKASVDQTHPLSVGYPSDGYSSVGNHPAHGVVPEWGQGVDGYAKRYASAFGMGLVGTSTRYGLGELLHEDVSYHRCECTGLLPRTEHAFLQSFVAHTRSGRAVPSLPALIAPFVGAEAGVAGWYPNRFNTSDALRTSSGLYYALPIKNVVAEFTGHR